MSENILTTSVTRAESPELLRSSIDQRIVKVRPSSTPIDQISRLAGARPAGSMKVDYYSVDMKAGNTLVKTTVPACAVDPADTFTIEITDPGLLSKSETVLFPEILVTPTGGTKTPLVAYVAAADGASVDLIPVNAPDGRVPEIKMAATVVRMGRAAGELDVQTSQYNALPKKDFNYCQIFKAQVEESLLQRLSDKEVGWSFSDQEEAAIMDMRMGIEKTYLFGHRAELPVADGESVYLTKGIWHQAGKEFSYRAGALNDDAVANLMREAFTGGAGSPRKILIGGSKLIQELHKLNLVRYAGASDTETVWGIDFKTIVSKFGTLYVLLSEVFDHCGIPGHGMIIDPEYISKYTHIPFTAERISFHKQGLRNTEGVVLTEASCLVLRYPEAHMRITVNALGTMVSNEPALSL